MQVYSVQLLFFWSALHIYLLNPKSFTCMLQDKLFHVITLRYQVKMLRKFLILRCHYNDSQNLFLLITLVELCFHSNQTKSSTDTKMGTCSIWEQSTDTDAQRLCPNRKRMLSHYLWHGQIPSIYLWPDSDKSALASFINIWCSMKDNMVSWSPPMSSAQFTEKSSDSKVL